MKKIILNKTILLIIALILFLGLAPISSACTLLELTFEDIVISSKIDKDAYKPLDEMTEFEASAEDIYATIGYSNAKGDDNFRFKWTNLDTGEIVRDVEDKYAEDMKGKYVSGTTFSRVSSGDFESKIIPSGDYKVEYYHNGEIVKTTTFKVNKPQPKIIEVLLTNQVNENYEPVSASQIQNFNSNETVYACVKFDIQAPGNNVKAKWLSDAGVLIFESGIDMTSDYTDPSFITFWFPENPGPVQPGIYKVEIYLNDNLYGSLDFEVTGEVSEAVDIVITFNQGNTFTEAQGKYFFTINYPDDWQYTWTEDSTGMNAGFKSPEKDIYLGTVMAVVNEGSGIKESDFTALADESVKGIVQNISEDMQQIGETSISDWELPDGTPFKEYIYYFNDNSSSKKGEFAVILDIIQKFGKLYIWIGVASEVYYDQLNMVYQEGLKTLVLEK